MEILFSLLSFLVNLHLPPNSFSKHTAHNKGQVVIILFRTSLTCNTFVFLFQLFNNACDYANMQKYELSLNSQF